MCQIWSTLQLPVHFPVTGQGKATMRTKLGPYLSLSQYVMRPATLKPGGSLATLQLPLKGLRNVARDHTVGRNIPNMLTVKSDTFGFSLVNKPDVKSVPW